MPTVTVATLQARVCTLCDLNAALSTTTNPTAAQMLDLLKTSTEQLGAIVREYSAEQYLTASTTLETSSFTGAVALPGGFANLVRLTWVRDDREVPLELANSDELFEQPQPGSVNPWTSDGASRPKYRMLEGFLQLYPAPGGVHTLRVYYAGGFTVSSLLDSLELREGWDQWIVLTTCIMVRARQQKDASEFWTLLKGVDGQSGVEGNIRKQMKRDNFGSKVIRDQRGMNTYPNDAWPYYGARRFRW